jgi:hypothetical protein
MIERTHGPCVFCRQLMKYGSHSAKTGYGKQPYMTDAWVDKQAAFWPEHMAATDHRQIYTRDKSNTCTNVEMTEIWMSEWRFSIYVDSPSPKQHAFDLLEPFACPDCTAVLKAKAEPGRLAFERQHNDLAADILASRASSRRKEFVLIRGRRA